MMSLEIEMMKSLVGFYDFTVAEERQQTGTDHSRRLVGHLSYTLPLLKPLSVPLALSSLLCLLSPLHIISPLPNV